MTLKKWDPFVDLETFREEFDRLFDDMLRKSWGRVDRAWGAPWTLHADVYEAEGTIHVDVDLPGVDPKEVEVEVFGNVLMIRGARASKREERGKSLYRVERHSGGFARTIQLPAVVDPATLDVKFEGGVLHIRVAPAGPEGEEPAA